MKHNPPRPARYPLNTLTLHAGIECSPPDNFSVPLDSYVPKSEGPFPAVLFIHGGGWRNRQVEADKPLAERLASRGYVVAQVAYRLSDEGKYPAALHDCKAALRFLRAHAKDYEIHRAAASCGSALHAQYREKVIVDPHSRVHH